MPELGSIFKPPGVPGCGDTLDKLLVRNRAADEPDDDEPEDGSLLDTAGLGVVNMVERSVL